GSLGLKASEGLRQARQKWVDRHRVGPNALSRTVSSLPQNGHVAAPSVRPNVASGRKAGPPSPGGVKPYERRASRPAEVIRSLVQGGEYTNRAVTVRPGAAS